MTLSLKEILAAKKIKLEVEASIADDIIVEDNSDCFSLTSSTAVTSEASLRVLLSLCYVSAHRSNLLTNDNENLKILCAWLGPFNAYHLPYKEPIPKLLQSYMLWQLGAITGIPPAKLWGEILSIIVESHEKNA